MKLLVASATAFEIAPFEEFLESHCEKASFFEYKLNDHSIYPMVTGVGAVNMAFALSRMNKMKEIDFAINAGIAGGFPNGPATGSVVEVVSDRFADLGVEENDGSFTDVFEMELIGRNAFPYHDGWIHNDNVKYINDLPKVKGITVNKVHGCASSIASITQKYKADIESMEGAAFLFACKQMDVKCTQIRSISNVVEPRNRANWRIGEAIDHLNEFLISYIKSLLT